jgi:hypothetical protein
MAVMVEAQQDTVQDIEKQAQKVEVDTGAGLVNYRAMLDLINWIFVDCGMKKRPSDTLGARGERGGFSSSFFSLVSLFSPSYLVSCLASRKALAESLSVCFIFPYLILDCRRHIIATDLLYILFSDTRINNILTTYHEFFKL